FSYTLSIYSRLHYFAWLQCEIITRNLTLNSCILQGMEYALAALLAISLTVVLTPLALKLAHRFDLIDYAKPDHPGVLQTKPLPHAGGLAMYAGFVVATLLLIPMSPQLWAIMFAAGINVLVGTLDDRRSIHPVIRLGTLGLTSLLVILAGVTIPWITNPFAAVTDENWLIY